MIVVSSRSHNFADFAFADFVWRTCQPRAWRPHQEAELGLPESLVGALPIVGAANLAMRMELDESATLPTMVKKLEAALGLQPSTAAAATAAPAPAPAAPAAA